MKKILVMLASVMAGSGAAMAASAINSDAEPRTLIVTEGSTQSEVVLGAGETAQFCPDGCFVTMPNGDREALTGAETIEIQNGRARFR